VYFFPCGEKKRLFATVRWRENFNAKINKKGTPGILKTVQAKKKKRTFEGSGGFDYLLMPRRGLATCPPIKTERKGKKGWI